MESVLLHLAHNNFENNLKGILSELRRDQTFSDIQLVCDDDQGDAVVLPAHKVILAGSSPFFSNLLRGLSHPQLALYLKGIPLKQLTLVLDFIYNGEVDVMQDDLDLFLNAAIDLKVQGLTPASPGQASDDLTSTPDSMPSTPPPIQITHDRQHSHSRSPPSADRSSRPQFQSPISPTPVSDLLSPSSSTAPDAETDPGLVVKTELIEPSSSEIEERESTWRPKDWSDLRRFITRLANDEKGDTVYSCNMCHQRSKKSSNLYKHVEFAHFNGALKHTCSYCDEEFENRYRLDNHTFRKHRAPKVENADKKSQIKRTAAHNFKKISEHEELEDTVRQGPVGAVIESFSDLEQFVSKLPNENGRGAWQCTICQMKGSSRDNMKRHVEAHHFRGFLQHKCNLCDNESETRERLYHHIRTKHGNGSSSRRSTKK